MLGSSTLRLAGCYILAWAAACTVLVVAISVDRDPALQQGLLAHAETTSAADHRTRWLPPVPQRSSQFVDEQIATCSDSCWRKLSQFEPGPSGRPARFPSDPWKSAAVTWPMDAHSPVQRSGVAPFKEFCQTAKFPANMLLFHGTDTAFDLPRNRPTWFSVSLPVSFSHAIQTRLRQIRIAEDEYKQQLAKEKGDDEKSAGGGQPGQPVALPRPNHGVGEFYINVYRAMEDMTLYVNPAGRTTYGNSLEICSHFYYLRHLIKTMDDVETVKMLVAKIASLTGARPVGASSVHVGGPGAGSVAGGSSSGSVLSGLGGNGGGLASGPERKRRLSESEEAADDPLHVPLGEAAPGSVIAKVNRLITDLDNSLEVDDLSFKGFYEFIKRLPACPDDKVGNSLLQSLRCKLDYMFVITEGTAKTLKFSNLCRDAHAAGKPKGWRAPWDENEIMMCGSEAGSRVAAARAAAGNSATPTSLEGVERLGRLNCALRRVCNAAKTVAASNKRGVDPRVDMFTARVNCDDHNTWDLLSTGVMFPLDKHRAAAQPGRHTTEYEGQTLGVMQAPFLTHEKQGNYDFLKKLINEGACVFHAADAPPGSCSGSGCTIM